MIEFPNTRLPARAAGHRRALLAAALALAAAALLPLLQRHLAAAPLAGGRAAAALWALPAAAALAGAAGACLHLAGLALLLSVWRTARPGLGLALPRRPGPTWRAALPVAALLLLAAAAHVPLAALRHVGLPPLPGPAALLPPLVAALAALGCWLALALAVSRVVLDGAGPGRALRQLRRGVRLDAGCALLVASAAAALLAQQGLGAALVPDVVGVGPTARAELLAGSSTWVLAALAGWACQGLALVAVARLVLRARGLGSGGPQRAVSVLR